MRSWDKPGRDLLTASAASGVKRARARFRLLRGTGEPVVLESPWNTRGGGSSSQLPVLVVQVDPVLAPVLAVGDELEVPAVKRVERVRHPDAPVPIVRIGCS